MSELRPNPVHDVPEVAAFRPVPRTGVIYVTVEAQKRGYTHDAPDWCNLGQGQPDTSPLPGAPERVTNIPVHPEDLDYAPVPGVWELREAVAGLYNQLFRRGMKSKYSAENVAIAGGGRVAVMRACAAIAPIHLGHFLPDYTAYEELLDVFRRFLPIPILLDPKHWLRVHAPGAGRRNPRPWIERDSIQQSVQSDWKGRARRCAGGMGGDCTRFGLRPAAR